MASNLIFILIGAAIGGGIQLSISRETEKKLRKEIGERNNLILSLRQKGRVEKQETVYWFNRYKSERERLNNGTFLTEDTKEVVNDAARVAMIAAHPDIGNGKYTTEEFMAFKALYDATK